MIGTFHNVIFDIMNDIYILVKDIIDVECIWFVIVCSFTLKGRDGDRKMNEVFRGEYRKLGVRVAYFRKQKDMSQQDVANVLGTEGAYVSKIERGKVGLTLDKLFLVAKTLGVPAYCLLDFRDMQDS